MKITRRAALGLMASTMLPLRARAAATEPEMLRELVESGKLPPMAGRLPVTPRVINLSALGREPGRHGGDIRTVIGGQKDIRLMTINGYSRLVGFDEKLKLEPDILEKVDVVEDRIYTFHIREGHKWSDGSPVTTEDFRYTFEDVLLNEDISSGGLPVSMKAGGKGPLFEIVGDRSVRFTWESPNPDFLPKLASAQPIVLLLPSAYMKQFHEKYQDGDKLKELMKKFKAKKWTALHIKMSRQYRPENPDLPTLDPWRNTTAPPAEQFVFERNPYFHRVDENGLQLPYIDRVILGVSSSAIIAAKTGAGESDLQSSGIDFTDYTFLKDSEKRYPVKVHLWKRTIGSRIALLPSMNYEDAVWKPILRDVRFRRALSLAIDRREINMAVFYGLGKESADTALPESPLYDEKVAKAWIAHDVAKANALLDEMGLTERDDDGLRLLPDGRGMQIIVETAGESTLETDVLELVTDYWSKVGLSLFIKTSQRDIFRSRAIAGQVMVAIWSGLDNGLPTADMNPSQLAPTSEDQYQWPLWGIHYLTGGEQGEAPDLPEAVELMTLLRQWQSSMTMEDKTVIWKKMLAIYAEQVFSIGIVNQTLQPILANARLRNLPAQGLYGFEPTCYFGVYKPDTFWLTEAG